MNKYGFSTITEIQLSLSKWKFPSSISLWTLNLKARLIFTLGWCSQVLKFNPPKLTPVHGHSLCLASLDTRLCSEMNWTRAWEWICAYPTLQEKELDTYSRWVWPPCTKEGANLGFPPPPQARTRLVLVRRQGSRQQEDRRKDKMQRMCRRRSSFLYSSDFMPWLYDNVNEPEKNHNIHQGLLFRACTPSPKSFPIY